MTRVNPHNLTHESWSAGVWVFIGFAALGGLYLLFMIGDWAFKAAESWRSAPRTHIAGGGVTILATPQCPGFVQTLTLTTSSAYLINPGATCFVFSRTLQGVARFVGPNGHIDIGPEGAFDPLDVETVQAAFNTAVVKYVLCPGMKKNFNTWTCE